MRVYDLRLASEQELRSAFARVTDSPRVSSCSIEPEFLQLRFIAPASVADAIVERVYLDRGLVWCSRHDFRMTDVDGVEIPGGAKLHPIHEGR